MVRTLRFHVPDNIRWDALAMRLFEENAQFFSPATIEVECDGRTVLIRTDWPGEESLLLDRLDSLARRIATSLRDADEAVVFLGGTARSANHDPMPMLLDRGEAMPTGRGRFITRGRLFALIEALDTFFGGFALRQGAEQTMVGSSIPLSILQRTGYLKSFPHHVRFSGRFRREARALESFSGDAARSDEAGSSWVDELDAATEALSPTVCYHCFAAHADRALHRDLLLTASAVCHRAEHLAREDLSRLEEFHMREFIAIGTTQTVAQALSAAADHSVRVFERWELHFRLATATDAFFAASNVDRAYFQTLLGLKRELSLRIGHSGTWLAVASFNEHRSSLTDPLNITRDGKALKSGCVGWGLERLAYALFAQLGPEMTDWPATVRTDLGL